MGRGMLVPVNGADQSWGRPTRKQGYRFLGFWPTSDSLRFLPGLKRTS